MKAIVGNAHWRDQVNSQGHLAQYLWKCNCGQVHSARAARATGGRARKEKGAWIVGLGGEGGSSARGEKGRTANESRRFSC